MINKIKTEGIVQFIKFGMVGLLNWVSQTLNTDFNWHLYLIEEKNENKHCCPQKVGGGRIKEG